MAWDRMAHLPVDLPRISDGDELLPLVEVAGQVGGQDGHLYHLHHLQTRQQHQSLSVVSKTQSTNCYLFEIYSLN